MADTERRLADLAALFADNTSGQISAQDLRDFLVSALGGYASIYVQDGAAAQVVNIAPAKLTAFASNGQAAGCTPDHAQDQITLNTDGRYLVEGSFSLSGTAGRTVQLRARLDSIELPGIGARVTIPASGVIAVAFSGIADATAGDLLAVFAEADVDTTSVTIVDGSLSAKRIG